MGTALEPYYPEQRSVGLEAQYAGDTTLLKWERLQGKQDGKDNKCKSAPDAFNDSGGKRKQDGGKLALSKSFKSALVSKVQLSDAEVQDIVDGACVDAHKFEKDSDNESKD